MFILNDDMSIYITRGDTAVISVDATDQNGNAYVFQPGDVVRFKVVEKKNYDNVVLQRDLAVEAVTTRVSVLLEERDTRIGDVISKPVDYWYEVELNPFTNPQTIIGYDDYGAKIFKLLPEGKDIEVEITEEDVPVVDAELSLTSERPIQNQAVTRAMMNLSETVEETETRVLNAVETVEAFDEEIAEIKAGIGEANNKLDDKAEKSDIVPLSEMLVRQNHATWVNDYKTYGADSYAVNKYKEEMFSCPEFAYDFLLNPQAFVYWAKNNTLWKLFQNYNEVLSADKNTITTVAALLENETLLAQIIECEAAFRATHKGIASSYEYMVLANSLAKYKELVRTKQAHNIKTITGAKTNQTLENIYVVECQSVGHYSHWSNGYTGYGYSGLSYVPITESGDGAEIVLTTYISAPASESAQTAYPRGSSPIHTDLGYVSSITLHGNSDFDTDYPGYIKYIECENL